MSESEYYDFRDKGCPFRFGWDEGPCKRGLCIAYTEDQDKDSATASCAMMNRDYCMIANLNLEPIVFMRDKRKMMEQCPNGHKISCICSCGLGHRYCCSCSTYFTLEDIEFVSVRDKDK